MSTVSFLLLFTNRLLTIWLGRSFLFPFISAIFDQLDAGMKYLLEEEYDYDFQLIGISCHEKDYRICWGLNNVLGFSLARKEEDLEVAIKKSNRFSRHSLYFYLDEDTENEYSLLTNRSTMGFLVPEQSHADYLLMIKESYPVNRESLVASIKQIPFVLTAFEVNVCDLASKENLIF